jgi:Domain of unknown function (DUF4062)
MDLERKYQVFVSSTKSDLREEREKVLEALLEVDCIPIAMELFPPSDETAWEYIQRVIDQCDYYVLILAGKYGSIDLVSGLSFTEKEYRYAELKKKPIITFYHRDPGKLPLDLTEQDPQKQKQLEAFREVALSKLTKPYSHPSDLYGSVIHAINNLKKLRPEGGWIPAKYLPTIDVQQELERLRAENIDLRRRIEDSHGRTDAVHEIDSMPNHIAARPSMKEYLGESLRTANSVSVKVMAVSLHYSWDFLRDEIEALLSDAPEHKKMSVELLMVDPDHLAAVGLRDWQEKAQHVLEGVRTFVKESLLIAAGRLELVVYNYRNIPHWHGMLINNRYLFLGRSRWSVQADRRMCKLSIGEELYRVFASNDGFGGADRIASYNGWFDYYKYSGKLVVSAGAQEAGPQRRGRGKKGKTKSRRGKG